MSRSIVVYSVCLFNFVLYLRILRNKLTNNVTTNKNKITFFVLCLCYAAYIFTFIHKTALQYQILNQKIVLIFPSRNEANTFTFKEQNIKQIHVKNSLILICWKY